MGHIKHIKSNLDPQAFPGATFQIEGQVPESQCSEAKIEGDDATTDFITNRLYDPGKFTGFVLLGKKCTIISPPAVPPGIYTIQFRDDNFVRLSPQLQTAANVVYYIHDGGELILTRNAVSFAAYIHAAGYAYTIKGGKLYTDMPSGKLKNACTILFDPLT